MPRTTLNLEDDAMRAAEAHASRHGLTLGQAVSDLVRRGADPAVTTDDRQGLRVVRLPRRSPRVTTADVDRLRDDTP